MRDRHLHREYLRRTNAALYLLIVWALSGLSGFARSEEYSLVNNSSVIGQNYGYPDDRREAPLGSLDVLLETVYFAKNLELTGFSDTSAVDGETFIGFLMPMRARYRAHREFAFEVGGLFGQNFGDEDDLDVVEPLARMIYQPQSNVHMIAGTILPTHWVHDALLDDIQRFRSNTEQGFQTRVDRNRWKQDTWINWRIRERDNRAEEFEVGSTTQLRFCDDALWLDGQLFWAHVGGQKNSTDRVENNRTMAAGVSYGLRDLFEPGCIEALRLGIHYLNSHDVLSGSPGGDGVELSARADTYPTPEMLVRCFGAYFSGSGFSSWRGDPLYQFDEYYQLGCSGLYSHPSGLVLEAGIVGQQAEDRLNYTFQINLVWGQAFTFQRWAPR